MTNDPVQAAQRRGLFSGFEHYKTPTTAEYEAVLTRGVVVLDTNALLNLYRYTARVRTSLLAVLSALGDRLWEPDQVMVEFWRNREAALRDYGSAERDFQDKTSAAQKATVEAIHNFAKRVALNDTSKKPLIDSVEKVYSNLAKSFKEAMADSGTSKVTRDTNTDVVLLSLEPILDKRVGDPFDPESHKSAISEAEKRIKQQIPPGYEDSSKAGDHAAGDYLVWSQIIAEAKERTSDVLLVTGDIKDDWWRRWGGFKAAGPRFELLEEFSTKVGKRLFMLQPGDFLEMSAKVLGVAVPDENVAYARSVDHLHDFRVSERGLRYEYEALRAIARLLPPSEQFDAPRASPAFSKEYDVELRRDERRIGVAISYVNVGFLSRERILRLLPSVRDDRLTGVLIVSNTMPEPLAIDELADNSLATFVLWRGPQDDHALAAVINELLPGGNSETRLF